MCAVPGAGRPTEQVCWDRAASPTGRTTAAWKACRTPTRLGPDIVYIGTEGGFLPKPVVLTGQPITWVGDPTVFNVGNVDMFNLFLGPAERADVIIDFTNWAGKDPHPLQRRPGRRAGVRPPLRLHHRRAGPARPTAATAAFRPGAPPAQLEGPQVGYGPNTRTVMQFRVGGTVTGPNTFNLANLAGPLDAGNHPGQPHHARVGRLRGEPGPDHRRPGRLRRRLHQQPDLPVGVAGLGPRRASRTTPSCSRPSGGTIVTFPMEPKAMHDEMGASFDKEYARMSTNLGMQRPIPLTNNANMTPFMYTDPRHRVS